MPTRHKTANLLLAFVLVSVITSAVAEQKAKAAEPIDDVIARYKELVKEEPESIEAQCSLADAYIRKYHVTSENMLLFLARMIAKKAVKIAPNSPLPHLSMTRLLIAAEKRDMAMYHAQKAIVLDPGNAEAQQLFDLLGGKVPGNKNLPDMISQPETDISNPDGERLNGKIEEIIYSDGSIYKGNTQNNVLHGQGIMMWSNGDKYEGEWENSQQYGQGTMVWANGCKYEGEWEDSKQKGHGIMFWPNGDRYEGEWYNAKQHGQGTYLFADGGKYVGQYKDNSFSGGWYYWPDGKVTWSYVDPQGNWVHQASKP